MSLSSPGPQVRLARSSSSQQPETPSGLASVGLAASGSRDSTGSTGSTGSRSSLRSETASKVPGVKACGWGWGTGAGRAMSDVQSTSSWKRPSVLHVCCGSPLAALAASSVSGRANGRADHLPRQGSNRSASRPLKRPKAPCPLVRAAPAHVPSPSESSSAPVLQSPSSAALQRSSGCAPASLSGLHHHHPLAPTLSTPPMPIPVSIAQFLLDL